MPYEILEHTADLKIKVIGDNLKNLFEESNKAIAAILGEENIAKEKVQRKIKIEAMDPTSLLVDFLNEALSLSQIHKEIYTSVTIHNISEMLINAEVIGYRKTDEFKEDIKALTYHEANIIKRPDKKLETVLIFDI